MLLMSSVCHAFASVYCCFVSPSWKGLTSWLSFVMFNRVFVTFPRGQAWYLIVSIPDLCRLSYFHIASNVSNFMNGSFCLLGDLHLHHKYILCLFSNKIIAKIFIFVTKQDTKQDTKFIDSF